MFTNLTTQLAREKRRQMLAEASHRKRHQPDYPASGAPRGTEVIGRLAGAAAKIGMAAVAWPVRLRLPGEPAPADPGPRPPKAPAPATTTQAPKGGRATAYR